jgi:hypothetical protein
MASKETRLELREIVRERLRDAESALLRAEERARPRPDGKERTALNGGWSAVRREVRIARSALDEAIEVLLAKPDGRDAAQILAPIRNHLYEMASERDKATFVKKLAAATELLREGAAQIR